MVNKPAESIYSLVEKAYFRLQAGDVITRCLEEGTTDPMHELIQGMVLAGPGSLEALREIHSEVVKRKLQVYDDMNQVLNQLSIILKGYGINLDKHEISQVVQVLSEGRLGGIMDEAIRLTPQDRTSCMQVLKDSQELTTTLAGKQELLEAIETFLQDWLWGLTYQTLRQGEAGEGEKPLNLELQ